MLPNTTFSADQTPFAQRETFNDILIYNKNTLITFTRRVRTRATVFTGWHALKMHHRITTPRHKINFKYTMCPQSYQVRGGTRGTEHRTQNNHFSMRREGLSIFPRSVVVRGGLLHGTWLADHWYSTDGDTGHLSSPLRAPGYR